MMRVKGEESRQSQKEVSKMLKACCDERQRGTAWSDLSIKGNPQRIIVVGYGKGKNWEDGSVGRYELCM